MIRRACHRDIPKIEDLLSQVCLVHHNGRPDIYKDNLQKYNESDILDILTDEISPIYVAADEEDEVAGYAFCQIKAVENNKALMDRKYMYIDDFCVDEKYRKQHIGQTLMQAVLEDAKKIGVRSIELNVYF